MGETDEKRYMLKKLHSWKNESEEILVQKTYRAAKNLKLFKGIFRETETSDVRGSRKKTFFRKIWATVWRLTATMYQAYLKDVENFRVEGRDLEDDPRKANVLQKMMQYHQDKMYANDNLFLKLIWAFQNILNFGWTCAKVSRKFDPENGIDKQEFTLYPNDQVFPDMVAETDDQMRFIVFLNYMTKEDMEDMGWDTSELALNAAEQNQLRDVRYDEDEDPLNNYDGRSHYNATGVGSYPKPGSAPETSAEEITNRYNMYECFWRAKGKIMYAVSNNFDQFVIEPRESIYGKFPIVWGQCLTDAHKLIGEGFPEPLEGPQESFNYNLNMRKDGVALAMTGHTFVSRYGGVDMKSLQNRRVSGITVMDDVNAVKHEPMPDVTQSAYAEANADEMMMEEMSGINKGIQGMETADKATIGQINNQESHIKLDIYVALIGETFMKKFWNEMARQIQMFETDERIFRIANEQLRMETENPEQDDVYFVDDFEADCKVNVGPGTVGQNVHVQQTLLAMDRGIMTLQAIPALAQMGMIPPEGLKVPNISAMYEDLMPYIGHRDAKRYLMTLPPPKPEAIGTGGGGGGSATAPNNGSGTNNEMVQQGTMGGI